MLGAFVCDSSAMKRRRISSVAGRAVKLNLTQKEKYAAAAVWYTFFVLSAMLLSRSV